MPQKPKQEKIIQEKNFERNKKYHTCLTLEERKLIEEYIKEGFSGNEIAYKIGRGHNTINTEIRKNGGRINYNAKKAHKISREMLLSKRVHLSKLNSGKPYVNPLQRKIEILEMHFEIILDEINKLKGKQ